MKTLNERDQHFPTGGWGQQITDTILMIEPIAFGHNNQTAVNNPFQQQSELTESEIQQLAIDEFTNMVTVLRLHGIKVIVVKDTIDPRTPDSIFPNNWVSFHLDGQVVLYPMFAENRRNERRKDIFDYLNEQGCSIKNIDDFTFWEKQNMFLEGTGSMILDRANRIAYATLSERTNLSVFLQFCKVFQYKPIHFNAFQNESNKKIKVYHTNIMMCIANEYAIVCLDIIENEDERKHLTEQLIKTNKEIVEISEVQMKNFAGNTLQVKNQAGKEFLILSKTAFNSLTEKQINTLKKHNELIIINIPTIEGIGGGGVRCMMAEIF